MHDFKGGGKYEPPGPCYAPSMEKFPSTPAERPNRSENTSHPESYLPENARKALRVAILAALAAGATPSGESRASAPEIEKHMEATAKKEAQKETQKLLHYMHTKDPRALSGTSFKIAPAHMASEYADYTLEVKTALEKLKPTLDAFRKNHNDFQDVLDRVRTQVVNGEHVTSNDAENVEKARYALSQLWLLPHFVDQGTVEKIVEEEVKKKTFSKKKGSRSSTAKKTSVVRVFDDTAVAESTQLRARLMFLNEQLSVFLSQTPEVQLEAYRDVMDKLERDQIPEAARSLFGEPPRERT